MQSHQRHTLSLAATLDRQRRNIDTSNTSIFFNNLFLIMDSQTYQAEMEQWKEDLRAARDQVSVGALSNSHFHIVSQFCVNHFY